MFSILFTKNCLEMIYQHVKLQDSIAFNSGVMARTRILAKDSKLNKISKRARVIFATYLLVIRYSPVKFHERKVPDLWPVSINEGR